MKTDDQIRSSFKIQKEGNNIINAYFLEDHDTWSEEESLRSVELEIEEAEKIFNAYPNQEFHIILNVLDQKRYDVNQEGLNKYTDALKKYNVGKIALVSEPRYMLSVMHSFLRPQNMPLLKIVSWFNSVEKARAWLKSQ